LAQGVEHDPRRKGEQDHHHDAADELSQDELPTQQEREQHAELNDEIGRRHHEDKRVAPRRLSGEECARHGTGGVTTR
jgi:hypothetical protein